MNDIKRRIFLFNAYGKYGGSYMLYQIGRICYDVFKTQVYIVQTYSGKRGGDRFQYPYEFPSISIKEMLDIMTPDDVFFCNPVHSHQAFGSRLSCKKVMYLQGVNTYTTLDRHFDHYISNSAFVQQHVKKYYHIDSKIIHPFIHIELFNKGIPWKNRSNQILLLTYKKETTYEFKQLMRRYLAKYPPGSLVFKRIQNLPQGQLAMIMGRHKYYLTLTPVEGFGLPPLEAMSSGCVVLGFNGYGGRDYFTSQNACAVEYQNYAPLIDFLYEINRNPDVGSSLSYNAVDTAKGYSFDHFKKEWTSFLGNRVFK
ncbi:MAG TPA: hypothetical protein VK111_11415 [Virgibacillus sp.]|nr:hypothetical protein [Virgibacillus sp.]